MNSTARNGLTAAAAAVAILFGSTLSLAAGATAGTRCFRPQDGPSGAELYGQHCAGCHGPKGDGKGTVPTTRPPRAFAEGGFAFGNTREALFKTISKGMPGKSDMQPFEGKLSEAERNAVIDHLLTLMPKARETAGAESKMIIRGSPVVVRGKLPSLAKGLPERPRGLLVGFPGGLSLEYRVDSARLLALRQGEFVDRRDWGDRGGSPLSPLGKTLLVFAGGDPDPTFCSADSEGTHPVESRFRGTEIAGDQVVLRYDLQDAALEGTVAVEERLGLLRLTDGVGISRRFHLSGNRKVELRLRLHPVDGATMEHDMNHPTRVTFTPAEGPVTCFFWHPKAGIAFVSGEPGGGVVIAPGTEDIEFGVEWVTGLTAGKVDYEKLRQEIAQ